MSEATGNGSFSEGRLPEAKAINIKTEIRLEERPGDSVMDAGSLKAFSLFSRLRKPVPVEKYPGSIVLRRYRAGDVVCRQGEPGFSAFYVPTAEDLKRWTGNPASPSVDLDGSQEISTLPQQVLTAYIFQGTSTARRRGFLRRLFGRSPKRKRVDITEIPNDGPTDIDAETRQAPILEGDVFGEMSCMTFAPRSATIVAKQDCRLMEFNRNIFDQLQKDEEYRKWNNAIYVERVLNSHLRRLELFSDLNPDQLEELKSGVTLEVVEPGALICEEGESPADHALDVFIVRSGVVQVARNVSVSLKSKDIRDWKTLCQQMVASASAVQSAEKSEMAPAVVPGSPGNPFPGVRPATKSSELPIDEGLTNSLLRSRLPEVLGDHRHVVYAWLNDDIQQAICRLAGEENSTEEDRELILEGLNALIRSRDYLLTLQMQPVFQRPEVLRRISSFPNGVKGIKKDWSDMDVRTTARFLIADAFPDAVRSKEESTAPPRVLAYLSRGDCFGEIAVVRKEPRGASCIAYDHPPDSSGRRPGRVELVRISGKVFEKLMEDSHELRSRVLKLAGERIQRDASTTEATAGAAAMTATSEFQNLGLFQGNRLLLIDLDRCTRCGECVSACVDTHDDGYSRLFLDGPRFDRFLIPSACRSCLNPACMIGCPVGSITRGSNGQIEIYDWCIGCRVCADQCPYDSIQMHDLGLIPEQTIGWEFATSDQAGPNWQSRARVTGEWATGTSPFFWTRDFQAALGSDSRAWKRLCFRYKLARQGVSRHGDMIRRPSAFRLVLQCPSDSVQMSINGQPVKLSQSASQKRRGEFEATVSASLLRHRDNIIGAELEMDGRDIGEGDPLFSLRLDAIPEAGKRTLEMVAGKGTAEIETVTHRAAVCDLCSHIRSQEPACVTSCPHEAAMRVDPLVNFPV